jgi:flavin-dependent dehydrogenase
MDPKMDVVIVGGGPAGAAAAITARSMGLRTTLITRQQTTATVPVSPLESIHPGVKSLLDKLGAGGAIAAAQQSTYSGIYSGGQLAPLSPDPSDPWFGSHISRQDFDAHLLRQAMESGVEIWSGERVTGARREEQGYWIDLASGKSIAARFLIDASGRRRVIGNALKFRQQYYSRPLTTWSGVAVNIPAALLAGITTSFIPEPHGWTWLAPAPPGRCSWTRLSYTSAVNLLPPPLLQDYEQQGPVLTANVRWRATRPAALNNVFFIGDAAGVLDPGAGQGILNALLSGIAVMHFIQADVRGEGGDEASICRAYDDWFIYQFEEKVNRLGEYYKNLGLCTLSMLDYQ